MTTPKRKQPSLGEIYAIPLANGLYGFARVYLKGKFGVFDYAASDLPDPRWLSRQQVAFWVDCIDDPVETGMWQLLGRVPFSSLDLAWPPPVYHRNAKDPLFFEINHRNERRAGGQGDIAGLEPIKMWSEAMVRDRIQSQVVEDRPWDIRAHCPYCRELEASYGPNYEVVVAEKFRYPSRLRLEYPPGTVIDAIDLESYLRALLKSSKSATIVIEFMSEEGLDRKDEIEELIDDALAKDSLGGVIGSGAIRHPGTDAPYCDLQLEVYNKQKAMTLIRRILKETGLQKATRIVVPE